jgi:hypothetical protein
VEWMGFDTQAGHLEAVVLGEEHPLQHSLRVRSVAAPSPVDYRLL